MEVYIAHTVYHEANAFHIIRMLRHYGKKKEKKERLKGAKQVD